MRTTTHALADLVDLQRLQRMCDSFAAAGDIGLAVLDPGGTVLVAAGWQDVCTEFHRVHADTLEACRESDARIDQRLSDGLHGPHAPRHVAHRRANGLWDVASPLVVADERLGNLVTGQFFYDDVVDVAAFRARARRLGFDEAAYLEALAGRHGQRRGRAVVARRAPRRPAAPRRRGALRRQARRRRRRGG